MSPNIDLDDDVLDFLKSNAEPFVDTPSTVLRRLLGIDSAVVELAASPMAATGTRLASTRAKTTRKSSKAGKPDKPKRTRAASGTLLPEERYERPLLKALVDAGGQAPYRDVVEAVGRELKDELLPADFETLTSGSIRWQSRLQFVRLRLIERGYLDKDAPRGVWGVTDEGRTVLATGDDS